MAELTYPASLFQPPPVTCPGCHRALPGPVDQCPHCGYNAWNCVGRFRYDPPPLNRYIDIDNRLPNEDRAKLDHLIDSLESEMPQLRIHICIVKLLPGTNVAECGFWMLNASVPRDDEELSHRPWGVLLLFDLQSASASATIGYGLDPFIDDDALRAALQGGQKNYSAGDFGAGLICTLAVLRGALREAHRRAVAAIRKYKP